MFPSAAEQNETKQLLLRNDKIKKWLWKETKQNLVFIFLTWNFKPQVDLVISYK